MWIVRRQNHGSELKLGFMSYSTYLHDVVRDIEYEGENAQVERIPITHKTLEVADAVERE